MAKQNRTTLKGYFETGDIPSQAQYADLIDSQLNLVETGTQTVEGNTTFEGNLSSSNIISSTHITASGNISASGIITGQDVTVESRLYFGDHGGSNTFINELTNGDLFINNGGLVTLNNITASGNIICFQL